MYINQIEVHLNPSEKEEFSSLPYVQYKHLFRPKIKHLFHFNKINSYSAITKSHIEVDGRDWAEGVLVLWQHVGPSLLLVKAFTENGITN